METNRTSYDAMRENSYEALHERGEMTTGGSFMQLLKSDLILNGGNYLKLAIALLGCFIAVDVIVSIFTINDLNNSKTGIVYRNEPVGPYIRDNYDYIRSRGMQIIMFACLFIISIALTILGSLTFSSMSSKRKRISTLMLPASVSQKFWLRFLIYTVGGTVLLVLGVLLSYLIAELAFEGAKYGNIWTGLTFMYRDENLGGRLILIIIIGIMWLYSGNSIYALGSAFWPRLSWIKTWIILIAVQWGVSIVMIFGAFSNINFEALVDFMIEAGPDFWLWMIVIFMTLFNVGCWALAYWRFRNTQIVQTFMKK